MPAARRSPGATRPVPPSEEPSRDRRRLHPRHPRVLRPRGRLRPRPRPALGVHVSLDFILGIGVAALLSAYLAYALLRPERF